MSPPPLMTVLAVIGGLVLFTAVLAFVAVRVRRAGDAEALALRAASVTQECKELLGGPDFLWAVWQDTAKAAAMKLLVRNARDEVVTAITTPSVPLDGVLKHFEFEGKHYEVRKTSLMSNRTCLRETGREEVLLNADHTMRKTTFYTGDGQTEIFRLPVTSVLKRFRPVESNGEQIGKLIVGLKRNAYARVLTLDGNRCPALAQVFMFASV